MAIIDILPIKEYSHLSNLLNYTTQGFKTAERELVTCTGCQLETAYEDFLFVKRKFQKTDKILAHQLIQSFLPGEISPEKAHEIGCRLAEKMLPGYQYTVSTHIDKGHIHNHIVFNSVNAVSGFKYCSNLSSLTLMRTAGDELCREYGLNIIENPSQYRKIDKDTYELASKGKSWKIKLVNDLDDILRDCASKEEFICRIEAKDYFVRYNDKNITITKNGEQKGIRVDTLAKQFGYQYTKENIEHKLNNEPLNEMLPCCKVVVDETKSEFQRLESWNFQQRSRNGNNSHEKKAVMEANLRYAIQLKRSINSSKSLSMFVLRNIALSLWMLNRKNREDYNGWNNYQKSQQNKKYQVTDIEKKAQAVFDIPFGNINYNTLTYSYGQNTTVKIEPEQIPLFEAMNFFYSGIIKADGKCLVTFKTVHADEVACLLNIKAEKLKEDRTEKKERAEERYKYRLMTSHAKENNLKIRKFANINCQQLERLDDNRVAFSYFRKGANDYVLVFFDEDLERICNILDFDYKTERGQFDEADQRKIYAQLKQEAKINQDKLAYRIIDAEKLEKLKNGNLRFAYFHKDNKISISFLNSDLDEFSNMLGFTKTTNKDKSYPENRKIYAQLKASALETNDKIIYRIVNNECLEKLKSSEMKFACFVKGDKFNVAFLESNINEFNDVLDYKNISTKPRAYRNSENARVYAEIKNAAVENNDKVIYRIIDRNGLEALQSSSLQFAYFDKGDKFNIAFLNSKLREYEEALDKKRINLQAQQEEEDKKQGKIHNLM